jgi:hypothetical protein
MPRSTSQLGIMAVVIGLAVVGASAIGITAAQSSFEQATRTTHSIKSAVSETDFQIGDHQQLRLADQSECPASRCPPG